MGFLEDLGATISQKSSEVAAKTRDMMDIASMNGQIDRHKKSVGAIFASIGERYFEEHKDDLGDPFAQDFAELNRLFGEIEELNEKISALKAVSATVSPNSSHSFCSGCGAELAVGDAFCPACGKRI